MILAALLALPVMALTPLKDTGRVCVADLGSNSLKIEVGEIAGGRYVQHHLSKRVVGVGDDMSGTGRISDGKLAEVEGVLRDFAEICRKQGAVKRLGVATAAYREATNGSAVVDAAKKHGFALEVASSQREAQLAYLACTLGVPGNAVLDIGSRTVELVTSDGSTYPYLINHLGYRVSYLRYFEKAKSFSAAADEYRKRVEADLPDLALLRGKTELFGIEISKPAHFLRGKGNVHGVKLTATEIDAKLGELERMSDADFTVLKRKKNIDGSLPRLILLKHVLNRAGYQSITVIDRELGAGVIAELAF